MKVTTNPKEFWKYANRKLKSRSGVSDLVDTQGNTITEDREKAELLNNLFSSVFVSEDLNSIPDITRQYAGPVLANIDIEVDKVEQKLRKLNGCKSPGPDGMHPRLLKEAASSIAEPLQIIFAKSMEEGILPQDWKIGNITPLHKKGSKKKAENYRPISLTSVIGKTLESLIRDKLVQHMMNQQLMSDCQHGFTPNRSCMTQLLCAIEEITSILDSGNPIDIVYLDFCKAFDSVPHERLLKKLSAYGIGENLIHG